MKFTLLCLAIAVTLPLLSCKDSNDSEAIPDPSVATMPDIPSVDKEVSHFMKKYKIPGLTLAITRDGKLVYAKGYGFSDLENRVAVDASSLFRIASVSKPITGISIMKLIEDGQISLDDKVFGPEGILGVKYGSQPYGKNIMDITVRHLLHHTAGGWPNDGNDPMFTNPTMTAKELISWTLDNRPLQDTPGATFAYSNFGYSILGRIIEEVTGERYENYVKSAILAPIGIKKMQIGGSTLADRKPNEVKYYAQNGENAYLHNISRMDAHGGWIASAIHLARLAVRVDNFPSVADILRPQSIKTMTTGSSANPNYALGWSVNNNDNWWHIGSLPGSSTEIVRAANGYNWVILTNTRVSGVEFLKDLDQIMWRVLENPNLQWSTIDLF